MSKRTISTLLDAKSSAELYLIEAELCANGTPVLGFAAMSLALACVVSIGEALVGQPKASASQCITAFCAKMKNLDWLLTPTGKPPAPDKILHGVRNALVHALSLSNDVCLAPRPDAYHTTYSNRFAIGIVPSLFVQAVRKTIDDIVQQQPKRAFDLSASTENRSPVIVDGPPSSGSMPG